MHCGRVKWSRISDTTMQLRRSLQFRYLNNQSLLLLFKLTSRFLYASAPIVYRLVLVICFFFHHAPPPSKLVIFIPATLTEIQKLISASGSSLDSIPTFLLQLCFNELGPIITNLVNILFFLKEFFQRLSNKLLSSHFSISSQQLPSSCT